MGGSSSAGGVAMNVSEKPRYVNPFTDFGFKRIFGEEPNKALLIDFLNELLKDEEGEIVELEYLKNEQVGRLPSDRRAIFDLHCRSQDGKRFIVEMQKTKEKYFKDRSLYYTTFPIQDQAIKSDHWDFKLHPIYTVAMLDFVFDEDKNPPDKFRYNVKLSDIETNLVFSNTLTMIYLEMPKFNKPLDRLESQFDKWLYALKHMPSLNQVPEGLQDDVFRRLFKIAEIAGFDEAESEAYRESLKVYWDLNNSFDTAREEGWEKGHEAGRIEGIEEGREEAQRGMARKLLNQGVAPDVIAEASGLSLEELERLKSN